MKQHTRTAHRHYNSFRANVAKASCHGQLFDAVARLLPVLGADSIAVVQQKSLSPALTFELTGHLGHPSFWRAYMELCQSNAEPLSKVLRISPHPFALSDLSSHRRLWSRAKHLRELMLRHEKTDAFAVPVFDHRDRPVLVIITGRELTLRPTHRHLLTQIANDVVEGLNTAPPTGALATLTPPSQQPHHLSLTTRQMEVASWLIAGKSDWEIGEILRISRKTVNYHVENIKRAYGVRSRNQFIAAIVYEGGLKPDTSYRPRPTN